jgi:hypothetical protein
MVRFCAALLYLAPATLLAQTNPFPDTASIAVFGTEAGGTSGVDEFTSDEILAVLNALCPSGEVIDFSRDDFSEDSFVFAAKCPGEFSVGPGSVYVTRMDDGTISLDLP